MVTATSLDLTSEILKFIFAPQTLYISYTLAPKKYFVKLCNTHTLREFGLSYGIEMYHFKSIIKKAPHVWLSHSKTMFYYYGVPLEIARHNIMACD